MLPIIGRGGPAQSGHHPGRRGPDAPLQPAGRARTPEQITGFFDGLDLVPPGVVSCSRWRPEPGPLPGGPAEVDEFSGVARKA
jgi:hypothetical protein